MNMWMDIWRDLAHAARSLAKARAFTFVCVVSLGVGMAPVIAIPYGTRIFTMPPAGVQTEGLVELVAPANGPRGESDEWSYPDFVDLRAAETGLTLAGWATGEAPVVLPEAGGAVSQARVLYVSAGYFQVVGVPLARGAGFGDTTDPVVILGHRYWERRLGAAPGVVGTTMTIAGLPHVVVGIAPPEFGGHLGYHDAELFLPIERHPTMLGDRSVKLDRAVAWVRIHGRLSPGLGLAPASAAVAAVTTRLGGTPAAAGDVRTGEVRPYHAMGTLEGAQLPVVLAVMQTLAALPLLVVCLNISGMVQVRSAIRERDLSIRQAIGATRGRLIRYLLTEAVVLAAAGGTLAACVLFSLPPLLSWWAGEPMPSHWREALRVDGAMLAVCAGTCLVTSLVFGWLPAIRFSRPAILSVLKDDTGGGGLRAGRVHRLTTALQAAIAVPLLVLSGMSLDRVRSTATGDLGFEADSLYAAPLALDATGLTRATGTLAQAGGVASVTVADGLPLDFRYRLSRVSLPVPPNEAPRLVAAHVTRVGDGYLDTLGITLLRGRGFTASDGPGAERVTLISRTLAALLFPDADPADALGRRVVFGTPDQDVPPPTLTIVGVTADFPTSQMSTERAQLLLPLAQYANVMRDSVRVLDDYGSGPQLLLVARGAAGESPARLTAALTRVMRDFDPDFDPASIVTGTNLRRRSMDDFLTQSAVAGISGGVILLLAALGIYGVVGMMVATRTRELAVRMTLGASRSRVIGMIVVDVIKLVVPGVAVGLVIAVALVRLNGGILGLPLSQIESLAYVAGAAIALVVAVAAGLPPARRAASVQPMVAMRSE